MPFGKKYSIQPNMKQLLLILPLAEKNALGSIRCMPGLLAAEQSGLVYVKGMDASENTGIKIKQLPVLHTYILDEQDFLFPLKGLTPVGKLEVLNWRPLHQFMPAQLPIAALPGVLKNKVVVKIIPSQSTQQGSALLTSLETWKAYATSAPEVRLSCTRFAVSEAGQVLITGYPLPPIQGREYWRVDNILLPPGYAFEIPLMAQLITAKLNPAGDAILLFDTEGGYEIIPVESLVQSSRAAIRLTNANITTT